MFKFLHAADIHLDSPLQGLQLYEGAPVDRIRGATRAALKNLVDLAIHEKVAFVLIAGDVYDGSWKDYNTGGFFNKEMSRLREAGIKALLIRGNHDSQSEITLSLRLPDNVIMLSTESPQTVILDAFDVAIHGQGFAAREEKQNLVAAYPLGDNGLLNIGMLHTSANGRAGHDTYAPCTLDDLKSRGYQYWALGHVHTREELSTEPWIVFPGNVQGRHIRETGSKGATLVTVDDREIISVEHRDLDVFRWAVCQVNAQGAVDSDEVLSRLHDGIERLCAVAEGRSLAVRMNIVGACHAHQDIARDVEKWKQEVRTAAMTASSGRVWVEKVVLRTSLPMAESALDADGPEADLVAILAELEHSDDLLQKAAGDLVQFVNRLPRDLRVGTDAINFEDKGFLHQLLAEVKQTLLPRARDIEG